MTRTVLASFSLEESSARSRGSPWKPNSFYFPSFPFIAEECFFLLADIFSRSGMPSSSTCPPSAFPGLGPAGAARGTRGVCSVEAVFQETRQHILNASVPFLSRTNIPRYSLCKIRIKNKQTKKLEGEKLIPSERPDYRMELKSRSLFKIGLFTRTREFSAKKKKKLREQ